MLEVKQKLLRMTVFQVSLPSIAQVGQILNVKITIDSGLWGDRQYSGYTYKWQYSLNGNWIDINTPSFPFYTVQHSDAGKYIRCVVTLDRDGSIANSSQTSIFESNLSYNTNQSDPNSKISIVNEVENINAIEGRKFSIYFDVTFIKFNIFSKKSVSLISMSESKNKVYGVSDIKAP